MNRPPPGSPGPYSAPSEGNIILAVATGVLAALLGAILWAFLVRVTHIKLGIAAIGIGYLVGLSIRSVGKSYNPVYGYIGAVLALMGCVAGDLVTDCALLADRYGKTLSDALSQLTPGIAFALLKAGFGPLDAVFYLLAVSAGYRTAFHKPVR